MAFTVTCPSCGKSFQLAAEIYERKVAGKVVSIKCKQCQAGIRVDATAPGQLKVVGATPAGDASVGPRAPAPAARPDPAPAPKPPAPAPVRPRQPTLIGMMNPSAGAQKLPAAKPKEPPTAPPRIWVVDSGGSGDDRELSEPDLEREVSSGALPTTTLVWREGMGEWLEIEAIPELQPMLKRVAKPKPAPPAETPRAPAATRDAPSAPRAPMPTPAFSEEESEATVVYDRSAPDAAPFPFETPKAPAAAAPPAPPLPAADAPPLPAARPAAPAPAAAQPLAPSPAVRLPAAQPLAHAAAPFAAAPPPIPARPAAPPASPLGAGAVPWDPPLQTQPVGGFPPAAPSGPDPFAVASTTDLDFPKAKSKAPLVIAAVIGVAAIVGIIVAVTQSSGPAPVTAPAAAPAVTSESMTTREPEPPSTTAQPSEPSQGGSGLPTEPAQPASGGFSDLFAKGAKGTSGADAGTRGK